MFRRAINIVEDPLFEALTHLLREEPPLPLTGVFNTNEISDEDYEILQHWASDTISKSGLSWATGLSMLDCANVIVSGAIENANIVDKEDLADE